MKLLNFTIIKLTIFLVLGILSAHYITLNFQIVLYITIGSIGLLGAYWLNLRSKINRTPYFGIMVYLSMVGIGMLSYNLQNEKLRPQHYTNLKSTKNYNSFTFQIEKRLKPDAYNRKYIVALKSFDNKIATGHLLINLQRDSLSEQINVDDVFFTSSQLKDIQKPLNPYQFDYSKFLELQQVYHQLYLNTDNILKVSDSKTTIYGYADALRTQINTKLIDAGFKKDALSIMNALLLGQRQTIDKNIYNNYVNSGTIHILAVSGLHVGIILWILNFIFRPLLYLKYGNFIRPFILITILWCFAVIAGLSPSVTRAVTMFSIISIAMHLKRRTNIYNTLVISAFVILLFKPTFLFAVGFQMSYLAVLGIVSIQPIIYKLWKPKYWIIDKPWQIFTVTLAAQVGVAPISLLYFHQFPGLFFISNLVVIPFLGLILGFGILVIAMALIGFLPKPVVSVYSFVINTLNNFIAWVAQFENFLFRDIPFTILQVIICYAMIVAFIQIYKFRNFKWTAFGLVTIMVFQGIFIYNKHDNKNDNFIIFNKSRYSMFGIKEKEKLNLFHNLDSAQLISNYAIKNYKVGESIDEIASDSLQFVYQYKNKIILAIDSLAIYKGVSFHPDYIVLRNSPRLNFNRVIDSLKPNLIIADGSNYKSYLKRWKATCAHKKIPYHQTNEKGAFIIE
ncbi:ComEC/Rec2 family competence protein [Winogradskyella bathintestinalis]|uniref:ComEC/Rec2 family competence protein n=1 Tax=Winogradskyella bathintestinalis TaxID=3035208 RepID=A0ABT7ZSK5_9FLAO|nr:ComEC/Rec2 family competence protein [Winogradskyella bathintestinalis]MDN3491997.1 ComEC/Rec2 family competence protein [Winogradskyella bathintestinalis]